MIFERVVMERVLCVWKDIYFSICGFMGRRTFVLGESRKMKGEIWFEFWLKMLIVFVKWRFREVYKLEFNDEVKKIIFEINLIRKEFKDL